MVYKCTYKQTEMFKAMKSLKVAFAALWLGIITCSCQSDFDDNKSVVMSQESEGARNDITLEVLKSSVVSRGDFDLEEYPEAYRCSSETSSLIADIYLSGDYEEATTLILNADLEPAYCLKFNTEGIDCENATMFTAFNELDEPIMSGKYNYTDCYLEITAVYGNDVVTRASAASWGCNLALWTCGTIWSVAVGSVSFGGGLLLGLAYTAAAIQICDGL